MKARLNAFLNRFGVEVHGVGYLQKLRNAGQEKSEWQAQRELLKGKAGIICDVGAHRGETVWQYVNLFPGATIHSFEPFPDSYAVLAKECGGRKTVVLNQCALSDKQGVATLNVNQDSGTNSLYESIKIGATSDKNCRTIGQVAVQTTTLDAYCRQKGIDGVDILKMDVQGSELKVLSGAVDLLRENRIKLIYAECFFKRQYSDQPLFHDISKFLYDHHFFLQDLYDPYYAKTGILWCNAIFLNANYF